MEGINGGFRRIHNRNNATYILYVIGKSKEKVLTFYLIDFES